MYCICCGMEITDKTEKCPRCGCIFGNIKPKAVENNSSGFIFCPNCGNILSNQLQICKICGSRI